MKLWHLCALLALVLAFAGPASAQGWQAGYGLTPGHYTWVANSGSSGTWNVKQLAPPGGLTLDWITSEKKLLDTYVACPDDQGHTFCNPVTGYTLVVNPDNTWTLDDTANHQSVDGGSWG